MKVLVARLALVLCAGSWSASAHADQPPATTAPSAPVPSPPAPAAPPRVPADRISYDTTLGFRANPIGFELQYNIAYRHRLYRSSSLALRDNYVGVTLSPTISPSVARMGGTLELRPLTLLTLQGGLHQVGYLGSFRNLQSFPTAAANYSDTALEAGKEAGRDYPTHGLEVFARSTALAKLGPIVIRDDLTFTYSKLSLLRDDRVYYHPRVDALVPDQGWFMHNDSDVIYLSDFGLAAGARASTTHVFYPDDVVGGDAAADNSPMFRVGPLLAYTIFDTPGAQFNKPTFVGIAQWWIQHRYRTGEDVHQGIPFAAVAFRFEGDLFRSAD